MSSRATDGSLAPVSNSAASSLDGPTRKSHEKTLGGVFAYTNGTDVESGRHERRFDPFNSIKNSSLHSLPHNVTAPNGNLKGGPGGSWERSHSKPGSVNSVGSGNVRSQDASVGPPKAHGPEAPTKLSAVETTAADYGINGDVERVLRPTDLGKARTHSTPAQSTNSDSYYPSRVVVTAQDGGMDGAFLSPPTAYGPYLNRFSSPAGMSSGAAIQDRRPGSSSDLPRLSQRHTLQVPRVPQGRPSRDFSFVPGPSEEVLSATGRFSPTHDTPRHRRGSLGLVRRSTRSDAHVDEPIPDEDAIRWTEAIRQKRASRRKRKEEEDEDRVIVGKKVEEGHQNWVTAYNMLTGIRFTVSRTNAKIDRELSDADFVAKHKFSFDITGNELTPSAKYDFKFKDYSPWVFRHLRAIFGIDPADYLMSLTSKYILSELGSPGKSGSFFYFSRDYKYIIKTIHHAEHKVLRKILRDYYNHVIENPNTLISQFYGLHRVKIPYGRKIHFVVMNNLFPPHRDIHQTFDLKGSTVGRDFKEEELATNPRATLKDLNWLRRDLHLEFDERIKQIFIEQLKRDVALFQRLHIMDYSLLVGMHDLEKGNDENLRENTLQVFQPGGDHSYESADDPQNFLIRTPSRLENARKARELRLTLKKEKPVPMGRLPLSAKMPESIAPHDDRRSRIFYGDDGGIRATHEDGRKGEEIYYLGIIDCLTHYGFVKRIEHFWKGLSHSRTQISPIPPQAYGERFINFVTGITMTKEEAERRKMSELASEVQGSQGRGSHAHPELSTIPSEDAPTDENERLHHSPDTWQPPRSPLSSPLCPTSASVEKTMRKAQKQLGKENETAEKEKRPSEEELPDRIMSTSESAEKATLPVIGEAGENSNENSSSSHQGNKTGRIRQVSQNTFGEADEYGEEADGDIHIQTRNVAGDQEKSRPMYSSPTPLEPEKSVVGLDGRISPLPELATYTGRSSA